MDLVLRNLIIGGNIKFNDDSLLSSSIEMSKLLGINRNPTTQLTSFNDHVLMNKELEVTQYVKVPELQVQTLIFSNIIGETQTRPFTNSLAADFITAHGEMELLKLYIIDMSNMKIHVEGNISTSTSYSEVTTNTITTRLRNDTVNSSIYDGVTLKYNQIILKTLTNETRLETNSTGVNIVSDGKITFDAEEITSSVAFRFPSPITNPHPFFTEIASSYITCRTRPSENLDIYDGFTINPNSIILQTVGGVYSSLDSSNAGLNIYSSGPLSFDSLEINFLTDIKLGGFAVKNCNEISSTTPGDLSLRCGTSGNIYFYSNFDLCFGINSTNGISANKKFNFSSFSPTERTLGVSIINLTESTGIYNGTPLGKVYQSGANLTLLNDVNSSKFLITGKDSSGVSTNFMDINSVNISINKPFTLTSNTPSERIAKVGGLYLIENTGTYNAQSLSNIYQTVANLVFVNTINSSRFQFIGRDSGGSTLTFMDVNSIDITMGRPVTFNKPFFLTSNTASERVGTLSTLYFTETSGAYSATPLSQIYQSAADVTFNNLVNSSRYLITGKNSSGVTSTFVLFSSTTMQVNTNITQPTLVLDSNQNVLKRTIICSNMNNTMDPLSLLELYDTSTGHGISVFPNLGGGNYAPIVQAGDTGIITRYPQDNNGFVFCNYASFSNGFRFAVTNSTTGTVLLRSGNNTLLIGSAMTATEVNHPFKFTASTAAGRKLQNLGSLEFTDIDGSGTTSTITMNASNMIYDDNGSASKHTFKVNDGSGTPVEKTVFIIENSSIKVQTNLSVRNNSETNNQLNISTSAVSTNVITTSIDATNATTSARNVIEFSCNQSSSDATPTQTKTTCMKLSTTEITNLLHTKLSTSSQPPADLLYQGGLITNSFAMTSILTDTSLHSMGNFTIVNPGSYMINLLYKLETEDTTSELLECYLGVNTSSTSFASSGQYELSNCFRQELKLNPATAKKTSFNTTFCCLIDTASTILYVNYQLNASIDYIKIGASYSITRLA